jgi:uncharacterized phage protein (TIGR01671 family)
MRELKFRAWDKEEVRMWSHDDIDKSDTNGIVMWGDIFNDDTEFIIMQYTGLKDKNGKEIYEGDVVRGSGSYEDNTDKVIWQTGEFVRYGKYNDGISTIGLNHGLAWFEVIGNIYENPELVTV